MTCFTSGMSRPLAATEVAINMGALPVLKSLRASSLSAWRRSLLNKNVYQLNSTTKSRQKTCNLALQSKFLWGLSWLVTFKCWRILVWIVLASKVILDVHKENKLFTWKIVLWTQSSSLFTTLPSIPLTVMFLTVLFGKCEMTTDSCNCQELNFDKMWQPFKLSIIMYHHINFVLPL